MNKKQRNTVTGRKWTRYRQQIVNGADDIRGAVAEIIQGDLWALDFESERDFREWVRGEIGIESPAEIVARLRVEADKISERHRMQRNERYSDERHKAGPDAA
jgi:hypothetical protein